MSKRWAEAELRFLKDNAEKMSVQALADALSVRIDASSAAHAEAMKEVVARHLDRFAFREAPLAFDWAPA